MEKTDGFIVFDNVSFEYPGGDDEKTGGETAEGSLTASGEPSGTSEPSATSGSGRKYAVSNLNFRVNKGEFVCVLGRNGSGKSTVARLMNGILLPTEGHVYVDGEDTAETKDLWEIRRKVGMCFQNPDNQIIATSVEEDVAFGLENIGVEREEMINRVDEALRVCGIEKYRKKEPHLLSGGQKQRVAVAGILAMKPSCIVLDESTSMLDPKGRRSVLNIVTKLNKEDGITVILITHHMDETPGCDRIYLIDEGRLVKEGTPKEIFSDRATVFELGLELPPTAELFSRLKEDGLDVPDAVLGIDEGLKVLFKSLSIN